ncbi:unnamed protein product [Angiostrongylus costaricensis]|uniref:Dynein light chain n=1 Tax=Angiostrongylus costaricensis TaxID=334426 RepID=A0A0R3PJH3_ANGCS|nr:unnamed protein product [Angiostrongylus costaricensis]
MMREEVSTVIRPVMFAHRQDMMSTSLDEKVDVKGRLNEADSSIKVIFHHCKNSGVPWTAVNGHLLLELHVAERQVDLLDPHTQV